MFSNSSDFSLQIKFWKTDIGVSTLREHSIIYNEATSCGNKGYQRHATTKDVATGHIYNLWPFTNITAHIVALNAKYEGQASVPIRFTTKEGGKCWDFTFVTNRWRFFIRLDGTTTLFYQ